MRELPKIKCRIIKEVKKRWKNRIVMRDIMIIHLPLLYVSISVNNLIKYEINRILLIIYILNKVLLIFCGIVIIIFTL